MLALPPKRRSCMRSESAQRRVRSLPECALVTTYHLAVERKRCERGAPQVVVEKPAFAVLHDITWTGRRKCCDRRTARDRLEHHEANTSDESAAARRCQLSLADIVATPYDTGIASTGGVRTGATAL